MRGHHQHRCCPSLFHNFRWFGIKAAVGHHPIVQKELLAKGTIEPSTGGAVSYYNVFFVPE